MSFLVVAVWMIQSHFEVFHFGYLVKHVCEHGTQLCPERLVTFPQYVCTGGEGVSVGWVCLYIKFKREDMLSPDMNIPLPKCVHDVVCVCPTLCMVVLFSMSCYCIYYT